jgi:hypothetical protein
MGFEMIGSIQIQQEWKGAHSDFKSYIFQMRYKSTVEKRIMEDISLSQWFSINVVSISA